MLQYPNLFARFHQTWKQSERYAGRLQNVITEIALLDVQHLAGARHGDICGELAG